MQEGCQGAEISLTEEEIRRLLRDGSLTGGLVVRGPEGARVWRLTMTAPDAGPRPAPHPGLPPRAA